MKLFQEIHCFIFRGALWLLIAVNKKGKKIKKVKDRLVLAGDTCGSLLQRAALMLDGSELAKTRSQVQSSGLTAVVLIYCGVPQTSQRTKNSVEKQLVQQPGGFQSQ